MSANAALKEQTYTVDAADPVTVAGVAIIRTQKTGVLARAFGRPEDARHKVAGKLRSIGHQQDIDAMYLEALESYVEENGIVPNATKVVVTAEILDRLPDPQFDSGHRVVFAINEDGTDFIGASEMGLAISPSGTTTTSRSGKVDERFGAITKQTLWIMIDFPEKSELDAIEMEQEKAFAAVAEAVADPVTAAENFDQIVAQVQELGSIADIDVAKTIETITNTIEAHSLATQAHTMIESGAATSDNPHVQAITAKIETLTQAVSEQLAKPDAVIPPAVAEMVQAVMETAQPPQVQATAPAPQTMDKAAPIVEAPTAQQNIAPSAPTPDFTPEQSQQTPQAIATPAVAEMVQAVMETAQPPQAQAVAPAPQTVESTAPVAEAPTAQQNNAASTTVTDFTPEQSQQAPQAIAPPAAIETPPAGVDVPAASEAKIPPSAPTMDSVESVAAIHTPKAFDQTPPPAALAAQVTAIATQIPAAQNTALTQTVIKQMATAIKNDQPVIAPLQQKVEAVIAKIPEGPAKQDLSRIVETVTAKQEVRQHSPAPTPAPAAAPTIAKLAFAQPASPVTPSPVHQPKKDNAPSVVPTNKGPAPITPTNTGPVPVPPTSPQPVPTGGGHGPDAPPVVPPTTGPQPSADPQNPPIPTNKGPDNAPPTPPEEMRRIVLETNPGHGGHGPEDFRRDPERDSKVVPIEFKDNSGGGGGPQNNSPAYTDVSFSTPCGRKGTCPSGCKCPFDDAASTPEEAAAHRQQTTQAMDNDMAQYERALTR